ncbi:MAG: HK97 gp10 family phage protein [Candidatus Weimeria sp.]
MKIKAEQLSDAIEMSVTEYVEDVNDIVKQKIKDAADEAVKELKEKSPKRTGRYAKGWKSTVQKETAIGAEVVVHNRVYQLTHLLEKGHAKRGGGRVEGIPHIAPVEEEISKKLADEIEEELKK